MSSAPCSAGSASSPSTSYLTWQSNSPARTQQRTTVPRHHRSVLPQLKINLPPTMISVGRSNGGGEM
eukprot:4650583-Prymnesium_polylepis.1